MSILYLPEGKEFGDWEAFGKYVRDNIAYSGHVIVFYMHGNREEEIVWGMRQALNFERCGKEFSIGDLHIYPRLWDQSDGC